MKKLFIIIISLALVFFGLDYFNIFKVSFSRAKWDKKSDINIVDNSISKTVEYYILNNQKGHLKNKLVVLNYWGLGCIPCIKEFPMLNNIASIASKDSDILCISICNNSTVANLNVLKKERKNLKFDFIPLDTKQGLLLSVNKLVAMQPTFNKIDESIQATPTTVIYDYKDSIYFYKSAALNVNDSLKIVQIINDYK
jgi:thiol-disulfide isomerase/thioredoxin